MKWNHLRCFNKYFLVLFCLANKFERYLGPISHHVLFYSFQEFFEDDGQIMTPLVAACRYGREKVVELLLANYKIELEKRCTVKFDGHIVHGASALWVAAGSGEEFCA